MILHNVALSNKDGEQTLNIPTENNKPVYALSSFQNISKDYIKIKVPKRKLDNYSLKNIGLIKIDVEGHEMAVLEGAVKTLTQNMPMLLIEIEARHTDNNFSKPVCFLENLGYRCFFIENKTIMSFAKFNQEKHQNLNNIFSDSYINNFIFVSKGLENKLYECMEFLKKI